MYKIGELSKLSNLPVKTLRFYDAEGLLPPDFVDELTGYRYYSAAKLSDCYRIIALKELGFSLREIKVLFSLPKENFSEFLKAKEEELLNLKKQTEERIAILRNLNSNLKERISMFDIVIRKSDEIRLAYDRKIVSSRMEGEEVLKQMRSVIPGAVTGHRAVLIDYETEYISETFDMGLGVEITGSLPKSCPYPEKIISFDTDTANLVCKSGEREDGLNALRKYVLSHDYQITGPVYRILYEDNAVEFKLPVVKLGDYDNSYREEINLPFVNDEDAIGHWEMADFLPCREMFHPQKQKSALIKDFARGLYFLPEGERYWCFAWTKGLLLSDSGYPHRKNQNPYTIEKIGGETYMFIDFKGPNYYRGGRTDTLVFRKLDSRAYRKEEIMITDEIPDLPADDSSILGNWKVCGLVRPAEIFDPHDPCPVIPYDALYWRTAEFLEGGGMRNSFKNQEDGSLHTDAPNVWRWVTGYVICNPRPTTSRYMIRRIENTDYLFVQWKSGDYSFAGDEPYWYVFRR